MSRVSPSEEFPAIFVPQGGNDGASNDPKRGTLEYWCPYCECIHTHGAAGMGDVSRIEHRGAHCLPGVSPHAGQGITLIVRPSDEGAQLHSPALIDLPHSSWTPRLRNNLHTQGPTIRRAVLRALLLDTRALRQAGKWRIRRSKDLQTVKIEVAGAEPETTHDLAGLASRIFALPWEVAARRLLETAIGRELPAKRALAVEAALRGDPNEAVP